MPYARGPVTPRNMGTQQCENIDVETQNTVGTDLGVHTSDPLLKVAKWIAYLTKIGPIVIAVVYLILLFLPYLLLLPMFFAIAHGLQALVYFAFFSLVGGVIGWCYLHFLWVKPSQYLLLGIQQLSVPKFVPWMLNAFIHSVIPAYFFFCYLTKRTNTLPYQLKFIIQPLFWIADLTDSIIGTYWYWVIVWTLTLTPQVLVLAAVIRVCRLNKERKRIECASLLTEPEVGAFQNIGTPTTTSPQPDLPWEDLPPSFSALEPSSSTLPPDLPTRL